MSEAGPTSAALGQSAEGRARSHLEAKGFRVVAGNLRTPGGELDLVAWDGEVLVFVEVKGRSNARHGAPEEAVDRRKRERLVSAAGAYLAQLGGSPPRCRFDVVAVDLSAKDKAVRHIPDAFRAGD
ncbi:hypothetical protein AAU61_12240 [Desulfocarbo indianensis]|nr:hypothetical protein AAU61_12240 [Desulfocarbo indianensis]